MGVFVCLVVLAFVAVLVTLFLGAVKGPSGGMHRWLVAVPLIVAFGWLIEQLIVGR